MELKDLKKAVLSMLKPEESESFLNVLNEFSSNQEDKELKNRFISRYNDIYQKIFMKYLNNPNEILQFFLRYSVIEDFITGDNIQKVNEFDKEELQTCVDMEYPILYVDEWISMVNSEDIPLTAGDDLTKMVKKQSPAEKLKDFMQKHQAESKNLEKLVVLRQSYITNIHNHWKKILMSIITKDDLDAMNLSGKIKNDQDISNILEVLPKLSAINSRISSLLNQIDMAVKTIDGLKGNVSQDDLDKIQDADNEVIAEEFKSVKQLFKMCIGRQGNEMPVLCDQYFPFKLLDRKNATELIKKIHTLDPTMFEREFLGIESNNPPYILLSPVIGKNGVCWEAIPKVNKETGRGKVSLPIYPSIDEELIIMRALADYRWQKEKDIAGFRWMSEGLTGQYYMYHEGLKTAKRKGKETIPFNPDLKESFIENYILWIKFESQGVQKLDKEVRKIFWFSIPFPDDIKEVLKDRGFHYKQLWENDQRKAKSQGY